MISKYAFIFSIVNFVSLAYAEFLCNGKITSQINSKVLVDGTNCELVGATVNGPLVVTNGGNITIKEGSNVFGNMEMTNAGYVIIESSTTSIRINKIDDSNGSGTLLVCGAIVPGGIYSSGRNGPVLIAEKTCAKTISWGPIKVIGGSDSFIMRNLSNQLSSLTVSDREGIVDVVFTAPVSTISIVGCYWAQIRGAFVYDKVTIMDIGHNGPPDVGGAAIAGSTVQGKIKIQNVLGYVCIPTVKSISVLELRDNSGGIGLYTSTLNHVICENNDFSPYDGLNTNDKLSVNSGTGQCSHL